MSELIMLVEKRKPDIISALRMKVSLWEKGVMVSGLAVKNDGDGDIPRQMIEDMVKLRVIASLDSKHQKKVSN
jgi:hypothetical protein